MENKKFASSPKSSHQEHNKNWWEKNPMTYNFSEQNITSGTKGFSKHPDTFSKITKDYFREIDNEFFTMASEYADTKDSETPFSNIIDFDLIKGKKILEIGCGMGSHSLILSKFASELISIDLTDISVKMTNKRFELFNVKNAKAMQADAESLPFDDGTFDFVWSWGVIHHSSNTNLIAHEIHRVLKEGGNSTIMIYNKNSTRYYLHGLYQGIFRFKFLKHRSLYAVNMTFTDGYIARHYTKKTAKSLFQNFKSIRTKVVDSGVPTFILGWGRLTKLFPSITNPINKWINNKWGWFLVVDLEK